MGRLFSPNNIIVAARASAFALAATLAITACKQGGGSVSSGGGGTGGSSSGSLTVTGVYPSTSTTFISTQDSASTYYVGGLELTIAGTCNGLVTIQVLNNDTSVTYPESAACDGTGSFVWSKIYGGGAPELNIASAPYYSTLKVQGVDVTNTATTLATVHVRMDNVAPAAPTILTVDGSSPGAGSPPDFIYAGPSATTTIAGTCPSDTYSVTGPGTITFTPNNPPTYGGAAKAWSSLVTVTPTGLNPTYNFYCWDLAGNQSAVKSQKITWTPTINFYYTGVYPLGKSLNASNFAVTKYVTLEATMGTLFETINASPTDSGLQFGATAMRFDSGFNASINQVRAH